MAKNTRDSIAVQTSIRHLSEAYDRFFKKQNDHPRFKSKRNNIQSYTTKYTNGNIEIVDNQLKHQSWDGFVLPNQER